MENKLNNFEENFLTLHPLLAIGYDPDENGIDFGTLKKYYRYVISKPQRTILYLCQRYLKYSPYKN